MALHSHSPRRVAKPSPCAREGCEENALWSVPETDGAARCLPLCRAHLEAYNQERIRATAKVRNWEAQLRADAVWRRPTWPNGHAPSDSGDAFLFERVRAEAARLRSGKGAGAAEEAKPRPQIFPPQAAAALAVLHLDTDADAETVRKRYRELVKRFHPDAPGGRDDTRLRELNRAWQELKPLLAAAKP